MGTETKSTQFRPEGDAVPIKRDEATGEAGPSPETPWSTWDAYFAQRKALPANFMEDRPLNQPLKPENIF